MSHVRLTDSPRFQTAQSSRRQSIFRKMHALAKAGGIRFSVRKCDVAKMPERFLSPVNVKLL